MSQQPGRHDAAFPRARKRGQDLRPALLRRPRSGLDISGSVISDIESMSGATGYFPDNLIVDRFGLNFDFIEAERLSWSENLVTSSGEDLANERHPDHGKPYVQNYLRQFGARKVEANALVVRPEAGRRLCLDAVRRYVPDAVLANFKPPQK